jgi:hypothetical protein
LVVRNAGGERELIMMQWRMPPPPKFGGLLPRGSPLEGHDMKTPKSNADLLREIVEQSVGHGIELLSHIELMEAQNSGGINERLSKAGLQNAAIAIRNAMMSRIVLMIAREFSKPRETDRNLHRAVELLSDATVQDIYKKNAKTMAEAQAHFKRCMGDNRLNEIRHFRDKYTAHIGEPKETPLPKYRDLFSFAKETVTCIDLIAEATGIAETKIADSNDAKDQAEAFWKPWHKET